MLRIAMNSRWFTVHLSSSAASPMGTLHVSLLFIDPTSTPVSHGIPQLSSSIHLIVIAIASIVINCLTKKRKKLSYLRKQTVKILSKSPVIQHTLYRGHRLCCGTQPLASHSNHRSHSLEYRWLAIPYFPQKAWCSAVDLHPHWTKLSGIQLYYLLVC